MIWFALEDLFQDNKDARSIELENELRNMILGDRSINDHCQRMKIVHDTSPDNPLNRITVIINAMVKGLASIFTNSFDSV